MLAAGLHYFQLSPSFLLLFLVVLGALVILVLLHVLRYAYVAMGIAPAAARGAAEWEDRPCRLGAF